MDHRRHWLLVASRDHALRGVDGGFVMANHGKRAPLARMSPGDGILVYSPRTSHPGGESLRAVTVIGQVTGEEPEPSSAIPGGFRRRASLRVVEPPLPLDDVRDHLPVSRLRFGFVELDPAAAEAVRARVSRGRSVGHAVRSGNEVDPDGTPVGSTSASAQGGI